MRALPASLCGPPPVPPCVPVLRGVPSSLLSESRPPRASLTEEYFKV